MDNGPARKAGHSRKLQEVGEKIGDPFEISSIRRDDFHCHRGKMEGDDVAQGARSIASTLTDRGHQGNVLCTPNQTYIESSSIFFFNLNLSSLFLFTKKLFL